MDLAELTGRYCDRIIFETVAGSRAYGTAHGDSDEDIRGVFVQPGSEYMILQEPLRQVADERGDVVYYSLARFLELALKANPNIIELLYMPQECVRVSTFYWERLLEQRSLFVTKLAYASHVGYAQAQIKKARGRNKWVNRPQAEAPPAREEFSWFSPRESADGTQLPYRPLPLADAGVDLHHCRMTPMEHTTHVYRLYRYGEETGGVFRDGNLVCDLIPSQDEEQHCIGLLIFNQSGYERAQRDHRHYWEWRRNRNDRRWRSQERGEIDYDAKNMMHTFRLLLCGEHILREGRPLVRFSGEDLALLKRILAGEFSYEELTERAKAKIIELGELHERSTLPDQPDRTLAMELLREITVAWEADFA